MEEKFVRKSTQDNFITEKVDIYKNNLLGEYDDNGNYAIAPQIVQELINLKKVRKNSYDNSMFCFGNLLGYGEITFEVSFEKTRDSENRATASLYVLEDVDKVNGYLQNIIKTKLADFVSNVGDFIEESYQRFNVTNESDDNDEEGKEKKSLDDLELDDSYILAKKAYMLLLDKLSDEKMLDAYGKYFTARLSNLTKLDNEFSNAVLDAFNQRYELIEDVFLKEKNYKALNELLDACIESISGTKQIYIDQENNFNEIMSEYLDDFTDSVNKLSDKAEQKAFGMLDPADRNKMDQMNASFDSVSGNNEVKFENIDDTIDNKNVIDESFENPVFDAFEEEKTVMQPEENGVEESIENEQSEPQPVEETTTQSEINSNTIEEKSDAVQNDIIKHILAMQEENDSEVDNDIDSSYYANKFEFQKNRQSDRVDSITDKLAKIIGDNDARIKSEYSNSSSDNYVEENETTVEETKGNTDIGQTSDVTDSDTPKDITFDNDNQEENGESAPSIYDVFGKTGYHANADIKEDDNNQIDSDDSSKQEKEELGNTNSRLHKDTFTNLFEKLESNSGKSSFANRDAKDDNDHSM